VRIFEACITPRMSSITTIDLPHIANWEFHFGKRCAIIGAGNVMVDVARFLIREIKADEVISVVRRGPAEVNFTKEEMKHIAAHLDLEAFDAEMSRIGPVLAGGRSGSSGRRQKVLEALPKADPRWETHAFALNSWLRHPA